MIQAQLSKEAQCSKISFDNISSVEGAFNFYNLDSVNVCALTFVHY